MSSISGSDSDSETENAPPPRLPRPLQLQQQDDTLSSCDSEGEMGGVSEGDTNAALEDSARKYPKIFFRNSEGLLVSVYRCVVYHKKVISKRVSFGIEFFQFLYEINIAYVVCKETLPYSKTWL